MLQRIRHSVEKAGRGDLLSNIVEADETYVGGKKHDGMRGRGASGKTPVVGIAERKGEVRLAVTEDTTALTKIITVAPRATSSGFTQPTLPKRQSQQSITLT